MEIIADYTNTTQAKSLQEHRTNRLNSNATNLQWQPQNQATRPRTKQRCCCQMQVRSRDPTKNQVPSTKAASNRWSQSSCHPVERKHMPPVAHNKSFTLLGIGIFRRSFLLPYSFSFLPVPNTVAVIMVFTILIRYLGDLQSPFLIFHSKRFFSARPTFREHMTEGSYHEKDGPLPPWPCA